MTADKSPPLPDSVVELIVRDACELDPADIDGPDTICIRAKDLQRIAERHIAALTDGAEPVAWQKRTVAMGVIGNWHGIGKREFDEIVRREWPDACTETRALFDHPAPRPSAALVELIRQLQWGFNHRRCPICAGFDPKGNGETDYRHTEDCPVAAALSAVSATPGGEECGANGSQGCSYRPCGPDGEVQCQYCGATPAPAESLEAVIGEMEAACPAYAGPDADYSVDASKVWRWAQALRAVSGGRDQELRDAIESRLYNIPAAKALIPALAPGHRLIYRDAFRWKDGVSGDVLPNHYDGRDIDGLADEFGYEVVADLGFAAVVRCEITTPAAPALPDGWKLKDTGEPFFPVRIQSPRGNVWFPEAASPGAQLALALLAAAPQREGG